VKQLIYFLKRPYPEQKDNQSYLLGIALISIFITLFLFTFQPFDLHLASDHPFIVCLGFGVITFIVSILYDFILHRVFHVKTKGQEYTLGKWIVITMGLILVIGIANYLFLDYLLQFHYVSLGNMILSTFLVGLFPLVFLGSMAVVKGERKYEAIAEDINQRPPRPDDKSIQVFGIDSNHIRYVEAMQNYIRLWYLENDTLVNKTERSTLSTFEDQIKSTALKRCHRSYIVNPSMIQKVTGNAQGLQLKLKDVKETIPVSRKFVDDFR